MKRLLFICTGNFYRSRFAEAVFNHHAEMRELPWRAFSRGLAVHLATGKISHHTAHALEKRLIERRHTAPDRQQLKEEDLAGADRVVVLDREEHFPMMTGQFADWAERVDYWDVPDVPIAQPEEALPLIESKVLGLIEELEG